MWNKHPDGVFVAKIRVRDIIAMGLTIHPSVIPDLPGHVVIPELSYANFQKDKTGTKDLALNLVHCHASKCG